MYLQTPFLLREQETGRHMLKTHNQLYVIEIKGIKQEVTGPEPGGVRWSG